VASVDPLSRRQTGRVADLLKQMYHHNDNSVCNPAPLVAAIFRVYVKSLRSICVPQMRLYEGSLSSALAEKQITRLALSIANISLLLPFMEQTVVVKEVWDVFQTAADLVLRLLNRAPQVSRPDLVYCANHQVMSCHV
jgi:hypothetical protein